MKRLMVILLLLILLIVALKYNHKEPENKSNKDTLKDFWNNCIAN